MIIYQIYPRSFLDANGDGIGDLNGIRLKLPYVKSLGVDAVWISPFFRSPMKDFGYDVSNYRDVDPFFGTMDDFKKLIEQASELEIKVIIDMVVSHTSDEHQWFSDSKSKSNGRSDWYLWSDPLPDGSPPNNWVSVFGGPAWKWDAERRQYYYHSFFESQPDLNLHCLDVQDQVLSEMRYWLDLGVSGFRFDACNHLFQDQRLRNNPSKEDCSKALHPYGFQLHVYDQGRPETLPFLERIRVLLDEYGAYSLAEVGGTDPLRLMGDYTREGRLHSAYSFALMQPDNTAEYVKNVIMTLEESVTFPGVPCYALSNHDKPRVASRWLRDRDPYLTAKQMIALLLCMKGDICMYQGEELGLPQAEVPFERLQDNFGKAFWPKFKGRDGCRTPIPWNRTEHAGFSSTEPWLPVDERHVQLNVADQEEDLNSVLNFTKRLIQVRKSLPELGSGDIKFLNLAEGVLSFTRSNDLVCIFNMDDVPREISIKIKETVAQQNVEVQGESHRLKVNGFCIARIELVHEE